jgi:hypothetical protein
MATTHLKKRFKKFDQPDEVDGEADFRVGPHRVEHLDGLRGIAALMRLELIRQAPLEK